MADSTTATSLVSEADLVPDRALRARDDDAFNHDAIAANLAEHVARAETPLNIALYGPWGSGKSSAHELLRRRVERKSVKLVRYDASRYGGESLRRNFISHAASELGFAPSKATRHFHEGLYEGRKTAGVEMPATKEGLGRLLSPLVPFVLIFLALLAGVALVGWGVSYLTDKNAPNQVAAFLTGLAVPVGVMALLVAAAKAALDGATVTAEQSQPSADEEFRRRFDELVDEARSKHGIERLVFFVDELDRCTPADVVKTLISIKTFLDHEHCVFIVAADRDVLEQALTTHLEQATPYNEDNPYYSSASSFLDKVFHHQTFLPPLRKMRLTHFARELVSDRGGLWRELRDHGSQRYLDRVIFALVPSHVVSPRRVKVLLNNFATNVRIAQSRGISWTERAPEIAKLTVLQTEFPSLAADLPQEPRLPELLLNPPASPSPRLEKLLARHRVEFYADQQPEATPADGADDELPATDPLLAAGDGSDDHDKRQRIVGVQNRDLRRYLKRTSGVGITGPGRDLLFLESVGSAHGLEDVALAEIVESDSLEEPDGVIAAVTGRSVDEKRAVVEVLCDMTEGEFGDERANVVSALMGVVEQLGRDVAPVAVRVVDALRSFQTEQELADGHLVGALEIGLAIDTEEGAGLVREVLADERLFANVGRTRQVALLLDRLPAETADQVAEQLAAYIGDDDRVLTEPLESLPESAAVALLTHQRIADAIISRHAALAESEPAEADRFIENLYDAVQGAEGDERAELLRALQWILLRDHVGYDVVRAHAEGVMEQLSAADVRDSHALYGLVRGDVADWKFWAAYLSGQPADLDWRPARVTEIALKIAGAAGQEDVLEVAERLSPYLTGLSAEQNEQVTHAISVATDERTWWTDAEALAAQKRIYRVALALAAAAETQLAEAIGDTLATDLRRGRQPPAQPGQSPRPHRLASTIALTGVRELSVLIIDRGGRALIDDVREVIGAADESVDAAAARTLLAIAKAAAPHGLDVDLGDEDVLMAALATGSAGDDAAADWMALDPPVPTVAALARTRGVWISQTLASAVSDWARGRSDEERTELVLALLDTPARIAFPRNVARHGIADERVVDEIAKLVGDASRHERRAELIDFLLAVEPSGRAAHVKVAKLMLALLERDTRVDFELALRAAPALGVDHQHGEKLKQAFDDATKRNGYQVPTKALEALSTANIRLKQRSIVESGWDAWKALWGGGGKRN
jgi:hypothetical protein